VLLSTYVYHELYAGLSISEKLSRTAAREAEEIRIQQDEDEESEVSDDDSEEESVRTRQIRAWFGYVRLHIRRDGQLKLPLCDPDVYRPQDVPEDMEVFGSGV